MVLRYSPALIVAIAIAYFGRGALEPRPEMQKHGIITTLRWFSLGNLTVVHVRPVGGDVTADWKAFNTNGDSLNPPWESLELSVPGEHYVVTDRECGNNELRVNDIPYQFDARTQCLVVTPGQGVSIGAGASWESSTRLFFEDF